jgi:hypothetical protein
MTSKTGLAVSLKSPVSDRSYSKSTDTRAGLASQGRVGSHLAFKHDHDGRG